jgi:hypothetical protein
MWGLDLQTIIALLCVAVAAVWWLQRARRWAASGTACGTACGRCPTDSANATPVVTIDGIGERSESQKKK